MFSAAYTDPSVNCSLLLWSRVFCFKFTLKLKIERVLEGKRTVVSTSCA